MITSFAEVVLGEIENSSDMVERYRKPKELRAIFKHVQSNHATSITHSEHSGLVLSQRKRKIGIHVF